MLRLQGRGGGLLGEGSRHRRILHHHRLNLHTAIISKILYYVDQDMSLLLIRVPGKVAQRSDPSLSLVFT